MESLTKEFTDFTLEPPRTGIVYHDDMLKHSYDEDPLKKQSHVEQPLRLKRIIDRLNSQGLLSKCEVITQMDEIDWQHVIEAHGQDYKDYLEELWPETKKHKISYIDTYYTKDSVRAARLAAESTRLATEKVWKGEWSNAYAVVRPPGHHAAAKNNRVCGFCFINNVIVSALWLQKHHNAKKILILDWDVHHGDSSQLLTYDNPDILYISIHKFCHGSFYPGELGGLNYLGKDKGEGYNLNFPLNPVITQFIGDSEYIYAFERAILPVIKSFNPEFVFISCGFDCLLDDPLGALHVTQDALSYMLYKIKNNVQSKVLIVLEGGYNLDQISIASECLTRVLMGESLPTSANNVNTDSNTIYKNAWPNRLFMENTKEVVNAWQKYWTVLNSDELVEYENDIRNLVKHEGHMVFNDILGIRADDNYIERPANNKDIVFFSEVYTKLTILKDLMPRGITLIDKECVKYVRYDNLMRSGNYSTLKITIGNNENSKNVLPEFYDKFQFSISGYAIKDENGNAIEKRTDIFMRLSESDTDRLSVRFFSFNNSENCRLVIRKIASFIGKLREALVTDNMGYSSLSILILYDPHLQKLKIKAMEMDDNISVGNKAFDNGLDGISNYFAGLQKYYPSS